MIKRMGLFQRREDLTQTQFSSYWAKKHSPLVMRMPEFLHYTQNHRMDMLPNFSSCHPAFDIDGIAEMYWRDEQAMQRDFNRQQSIELLRQDETEFMSRISVCLVQEHALQGQTGPVKLMLGLSSLPEILHAADFLQALTQAKGAQISHAEQVLARPQLPGLNAVPELFVSLWFEQYAHVLDNFQNEAWLEFYQRRLSAAERLSVWPVYALPVRIAPEQAASDSSVLQ